MKVTKKDLLPLRLQKIKVGDRAKIRPMKDLIMVGTREDEAILFLGGASFVISNSAMEEIAKGAFIKCKPIAQFMVNDKMMSIARSNGADEDFLKTLRMGTLIDIRVEHIELVEDKNEK